MEFVVYFLMLLAFLSLLKVLLLPSKRLPPSPRGLPLLGHLHLLGRAPHRSLKDLSKKFGDIMFLKLGMIPAIVISSPEMAKEVFKTHDLAFSSRPYLLVGEFISYNCKGVILSTGEHWKSMRKFCSTELFTVKRMESFWPVQLGEISNIISSISKANHSVINVREVVVGITFNVITQIAMSKRYFGDNASKEEIAEAEVFKEVMDEAVQFAFQFHISEFVPAWLRWIDWSRSQARRIRAKQDMFLQKIVDQHKSNKGSRSTPDFLDTLLQHQEDDEVVKSTMMDVVTAATDTSASTLEWTFLELLENPNVMSKIQAELDAVMEPNRMVTDSDFPKLTYLRDVVKETLRLHAPTPLLVPRKSTQACIVAGYNIPEGATTLINFYSMGRDPRFWEHPTKFWPERFSGSTIDVKGQDFELIPFGAGRRICPGMALGLKNVYLTLANLLHFFNWSRVPGRCYELEEAYGAVAWPKTPLQAQISPRRQVPHDI